VEAPGIETLWKCGYSAGFWQISDSEELDATPRIPRSSASWMHIWKHFKIQTKHRFAQRAPHVRVAIHDIAARVVRYRRARCA